MVESFVTFDILSDRFAERSSQIHTLGLRKVLEGIVVLAVYLDVLQFGI